jgi:hypothetical protein
MLARPAPPKSRVLLMLVSLLLAILAWALVTKINLETKDKELNDETDLGRYPDGSDL